MLFYLRSTPSISSSWLLGSSIRRRCAMAMWGSDRSMRRAFPFSPHSSMTSALKLTLSVRKCIFCKCSYTWARMDHWCAVRLARIVLLASKLRLAGDLLRCLHMASHAHLLIRMLPLFGPSILAEKILAYRRCSVYGMVCLFFYRKLEYQCNKMVRTLSVPSLASTPCRFFDPTNSAFPSRFSID